MNLVCDTEQHERLKQWPEGLAALTRLDGVQVQDGVVLEWRTCFCGSTICRELGWEP